MHLVVRLHFPSSPSVDIVIHWVRGEAIRITRLLTFRFTGAKSDSAETFRILGLDGPGELCADVWCGLGEEA